MPNKFKLFNSKLLFLLIGASLAISITGVLAAWNWDTNITGGEILTAEKWNSIVAKLKDLDVKVNAVGNTGGTNFLVVHSLSSAVPSLPAGQFDLLWSGYSLAGTQLSPGYDYSKNLNSPESCVPFFTPMPIIECASPTSCDFFTGGDAAMWLTSGLTADEAPVSGIANILPKIGRCAVFAPKKSVVIKYDNSIMGAATVSVPTGWSVVYNGYSLQGAALSPSYVGAGGSGCMQNFVPMPIIECTSPGACDFYTGGDFAGWATGLTVDEAPVSGVANILPKIGRCVVLIKN